MLIEMKTKKQEDYQVFWFPEAGYKDFHHYAELAGVVDNISWITPENDGEKYRVVVPVSDLKTMLSLKKSASGRVN